MQKCRLSFKSFNFIYIENSIQQICQAMAFWKIPAHSVIFHNSPTQRKRYTLLSSPHVHKKSREQFEWARKKGGITLEFAHRKHLLLILFWLQNAQFPGVELMITLHMSTGLSSTAIHQKKPGTPAVETLPEGRGIF